MDMNQFISFKGIFILEFNWRILFILSCLQDDDNRVTLVKNPEVPESDFINASPIKVHKVNLNNAQFRIINVNTTLKGNETDFELWRLMF